MMKKTIPIATFGIARPRDMTTPLGEVSMWGRQTVTSGRWDKLRVFGRYAVVYLIDGGGYYEDGNGLTQSIEPGDLILVFPELPHRYGPEAGKVWHEYYVVFEGPGFDLWRKQGLLDTARPVWHLEPVHQWLARLEAVLGASEHHGRADVATMLREVGRLQLWLADALACVSTQAGYDDQAAWVRRAIALIESSLPHEVDWDELSTTLGIGREVFRKRFTRWAGLSPGRYRATRLVQRAATLMQQGGLTDKQVAAELGYCDEFHFSRRFKQIMGVSPRAFRRRLPTP
ncbi:MAG: helix-turn-helix transcriptional regulator [Phycisphaeraceae bacterium]|nr:helix-turn-helix transcriptional regulator [Phycisphaeraceae bacterium]